MSFNDEIQETKKMLNQVSPSFCLAKWKQVTIHLQTGQTHSCHHPDTHLVPLQELNQDPSSLHNTQFKKLQRAMMLQGKRPSECQYCWNIEDLPGQLTSDRYIKSNDSWARPYFDQIKNLPASENVFPSYLEVSFSSKCNFKCLYCFPHISSAWEDEVRKDGPYQLTKPHNEFASLAEKYGFSSIEKDNPYVKAFWKWWPGLYPHLHVLRVTGGEPLLAESTYRVLEYVIQNPRPDLEIAINSNMGVPSATIDRFIESVKKARPHFGQFTLFTSIDTWTEQAEYIRSGLKLSYFEKNIQKVLQQMSPQNLTFMCTFNALSVPRFGILLEKVLEFKQLALVNGSQVLIDISYLRHPQFLSVHILPQSYFESLKVNLEFMIKNQAKEGVAGFHAYEIEKMQRLIEYCMTPPPDFNYEYNRKDFFLYTQQIDQRRNTNFKKCFPELADM